MFGFANGLLAFLALAAVLDFLPVLRHRRAPAVWWGEERLLFTTRYASVRQKYGAWAFLLGVMVYEFIVVFNNSMARENWPWLQTRVSPVLDWVMYLCFGFKILLGTKYNGRSMVCAGLLYFVARWVYFNGQNIWWLGLCVALLAAKDGPLRRVMKAFLACGVPTLALVELLHFAGIIAPDAASERNGSYRLMFGYGHPNTFGGVMFGLLLAWVLLRRARLTWPELAGVAAVGVFLMVGPKSRSAALCTFLLVLLLALAKLRTRRGQHPGSRPLAALCAATVPVLAAVSLFYAGSHWNSYFNAMLYINNSDMEVITIVLRRLVFLTTQVAEDSTFDWGAAGMPPIKAVKMATTVLSTLPILCIYPFVQKFFTQGVMVGSVKG